MTSVRLIREKSNRSNSLIGVKAIAWKVDQQIQISMNLYKPLINGFYEVLNKIKEISLNENISVGSTQLVGTCLKVHVNNLIEKAKLETYEDVENYLKLDYPKKVKIKDKILDLDLV